MKIATRPVTCSISLLAIVGTTLALAGCGAGGFDASGEQLTLRYALWDPNQQPAYEEVVKDFEAENPDIRVQIELLPWSEYWTKLYTQSSTGTQPDVFWVMPSNLTELAAKDAILPLDDLIERDNVDLSYALPTLTEAFKVNGITYGIEKDWDSAGIIYNSDMLAGAGYQAPPQDLTWNPEDGGTFVELMQALTVDRNGNNPTDPGFDAGNIVTYGFAYFTNDMSPGGDTSPWFYSNGGEIVNKSGQLQMDSPQNIETATFLKDLIHKYHVAPDYQALRSATPFSLFAGGKVASWATGPYSLSAIAEGADFPIGVGQLPAGPAGAWTRVNGLVDAISAKTANREAAWTFVKFITSEEAQQTLGRHGVVFPATDSGTQAMVDHWADAGTDIQPFVDAVQSEGHESVADPVIPNFLPFADLFQKTMGQILSDQTPVEDGLKKIQNEGSSIIAR